MSITRARSPRHIPSTWPTRPAASAAALLVLALTPQLASAEQITALVNFSALVTFDSASPGTAAAPLPVFGLQIGETLRAIDFRPATGQLYALSSFSRLYTIDTGALPFPNLTPIGSAGAFTLSGTDFGFDFNPVSDRIRVVSNTGQNLRLNPNDGTLSATDTPITPASSIVGSAYNNNFAGAASTSLYAIDSVTDTLNLQGSLDGSPLSPNGGVVSLIGSLGIDTSNDVGFDISGTTGIAYASFSHGITFLASPFNSLPPPPPGFLYTIDLDTGAATLVGQISNGLFNGFNVVDIAVAPVPEPATAALLAAALIPLLLRRRI